MHKHFRFVKIFDSLKKEYVKPKKAEPVVKLSKYTEKKLVNSISE